MQTIHRAGAVSGENYRRIVTIRDEERIAGWAAAFPYFLLVTLVWAVAVYLALGTLQ